MEDFKEDATEDADNLSEKMSTLDELAFECTELLNIINSISPYLRGSELTITINEFLNFLSKNTYSKDLSNIDFYAEIRVYAELILKQIRDLNRSKIAGTADASITVVENKITGKLIPLVESLGIKVSDKELHTKKEMEILLGKARELIRQMNERVDVVEDIKNKTSELVSRYDGDVTALLTRVDNAEEYVGARLLNADRMLESAKKSAEEKNKQLNDVLGYVSSRVISGDYDKNSKTEKDTADLLRLGSLLCMAFVIGIAIYSLVETTTQGFDWERQVVKILLMILIMIPAAYLARESEKHRRQQYAHLQKSLSLKTITPYLASLPEEEQHKIKSELATRIFGANIDDSKGDSFSYPINIHELLIEALKVVEKKSK